MGGIMSRKKTQTSPPNCRPATISPLDRAILDLKNSRDRLTKYRSKLAADSLKLTVRAKTLHAEGNTSNALRLMRLRKYKLEEADRVEEQLLTILRMVDKIAEKGNEQEVLQAMKRGKEALQILHDQIGLDNVLDLMDQIRDQDEMEKKICEAMGDEALRVIDEIEEGDILLELKELEQEAQLSTNINMETNKATNLRLPDVPTTPLPVSDATKAVETNVKVAVGIA